jgi:hypothetical protein
MIVKERDGTVVFEDARIIFRNFAGKEGQYNREGDRNFAVLLDPLVAQEMLNDGWNVKHLKVREHGDEPQAYLSVAVSFKGRPPRLVMITHRGRTQLTEDECELFDWVDIGMVDLIIRPYSWAVSGKSGVKAYLKSLFLTVAEDALERKYRDVPEIGQLAIEPRSLEDYIDGEVIDVDELPAIAGRVNDPPWGE